MIGKHRRGKTSWKCVYWLDSGRLPISGSERDLANAIRQAADLRIHTEFRHNEHIDTTSHNTELIQEVTDFRVTYLLEDRWCAGIITLRQPISLPDGFGPRPSMSFFMYNQNGQQAIARLFLDGRLPTEKLAALNDHSQMPKYHQLDVWDRKSNAPSTNFVYEFDHYRFCVSDTWRDVLSHTADGRVISGSIAALVRAFSQGCDVKVGIRRLCADLASDVANVIDHEVFVQVGSCYYYTKQKLFIAASHPAVRVKPGIPICYTSKGWDFGWLMLRSNGFVASLLVDPYTLKFRRSQGQYAIRWFVR